MDWITIDQLFTPDGVLVALNLQIYKEAILQDTAFDSESEDDDDEVQQGGSWLVVVPCTRLGKFLSSAGIVYLSLWTTNLMTTLQDSQHSARAKDELLQISCLASSK